ALLLLLRPSEIASYASYRWPQVHDNIRQHLCLESASWRGNLRILADPIPKSNDSAEGHSLDFWVLGKARVISLSLFMLEKVSANKLERRSWRRGLEDPDAKPKQP